MDIGRSTTKYLKDRKKSTEWLAEQLEVGLARANVIMNSRYVGGRLIERLSQVFEVKASEFIAAGE